MSDTRLKHRPDSVLEDPGTLAVATMYARSYMAAAAQNGVVAPEEELNSLVDGVLEKYPEFEDLLFSDSVGREDKLAIVDRVFGPQASEFFLNFLKVLIGHGRIAMLPLIQNVLGKLQDEAAGKRRIRIRTARPLSESSKAQIRKQVSEKLGFEAILQETVDASLIGGMVLQVGDTIYDSSLRTRLKELKGRLVEKVLNEIQSGRDRFSNSEGD